MRKLYTLLTAIIITSSAFAQAPEKMSYQAVVRDGSNALVASSSVGMQISILQGSSSGTAVYVETQTPTSNANGLVSFEIGTGTLVSGDFTTIDWVNGPYFVKTETDPTGGSAYTITGTSQLLSVPYALYAKNTASWQTNVDTTYTHNRVGIGTKNPTHALEVVGIGYGAAKALKLKRNRNTPNFGVLMDFNLLNSLNEDIKYGAIIGSIADNTAGAEKGFLSFGVADGSGTWSNGYTEERLRIETDRVTVKNIMRLKPLSAAPASPLEGDVYMNSVSHKLMVYDGTTWQACW